MHPWPIESFDRSTDGPVHSKVTHKWVPMKITKDMIPKFHGVQHIC